jgi:hypothetical protein
MQFSVRRFPVREIREQSRAFDSRGQEVTTWGGPISWLATRGGLVLAYVILLGFPGRRRSFALFRIVVCVAVLGGILACGGGSSGSTPPVGGNVSPGTTSDLYTITFRAADAATGTLTAQDYFTLSVN